jgi:DNA-binding IclR family transcriptional regulator
MSTVAKALGLLSLFTQARPQIGLSDLARLAEVNKATCYRLMTDLCDQGLAEQVGEAREYRLGPTSLRYAALREAHVPMRSAALPILQTMAQTTGETAHLSLLMGKTLRPVAHAYSTAYATKVTLDDTEDLPFHATSSGLAVLAFQTLSFQQSVLGADLPTLTARTETDPAALRQRLDRIISLGMSESAGGYDLDVHSLAVPLFDALDRCVGSVAIAALASRVADEKRDALIRTLKCAGRDITVAWGGNLPEPVAALWRDDA